MPGVVLNATSTHGFQITQTTRRVVSPRRAPENTSDLFEDLGSICVWPSVY